MIIIGLALVFGAGVVIGKLSVKQDNIAYSNYMTKEELQKRDMARAASVRYWKQVNKDISIAKDKEDRQNIVL